MYVLHLLAPPLTDRPSDSWISAILSFSVKPPFHPKPRESVLTDADTPQGAHLLLSLRTLAAKRSRGDVATPDISEDVPDISRGLSVPETPALWSPMELYELGPRSPKPAPALPRVVINHQTQETTACQRNPTWLQSWECT